MELRSRNNTVVYLLEARPEQIKLAAIPWGESRRCRCLIDGGRRLCFSLGVVVIDPPSMTGLSLAHLSTLGYVTSKVSTFVRVQCGVATSPEEGGGFTHLKQNCSTIKTQSVPKTCWTPLGFVYFFSISLLVISFSISELSDIVLIPNTGKVL